jgi:hypothetical protein
MGGTKAIFIQKVRGSTFIGGIILTFGWQLIITGYFVFKSDTMTSKWIRRSLRGSNINVKTATWRHRRVINGWIKRRRQYGNLNNHTCIQNTESQSGETERHQNEINIQIANDMADGCLQGNQAVSYVTGETIF